MVKSYELAWVAACLAPWALAPHPNFAQKEHSGPGQLSLVLLGRSGERGDQHSDHPLSPWERDLLQATEESLAFETQNGALLVLQSLSINKTVPIGGRLAAALILSAARGDQDQSDRALLELEHLSAYIAEAKETPHKHFTLTVLSQQRALRLADVGSISESGKLYRQSLAHLRLAGAEILLDAVPLSNGYSGGPARLMADLRFHLRSIAIAGISATESLHGTTWVKAVKRRQGWLETRLQQEIATARDDFMREAFERKFEATSRKQHFNRNSPASRGWSNLRLAELSGSVWTARGARRVLATNIILGDGVSDSFDAAESLKLLRQARALNEVKSFTRWLRKKGPLEALAKDASLIVAGVRRGEKTLSVEDLNVIRMAADLVAHADAVILGDGVWNSIAYRLREGLRDWSFVNQALHALAALEQWGSEPSESIRRLRRELDRFAELGQPIDNALAQFVSTIAMKDVAPEESLPLKHWLQSHKERLPEWPQVFAAAERAAVFDFDTSERIDFESTARLLGNNTDPSPRNLEETADFLVRSLAKTQENAKDGMASFGTYDEMELAVAFSLRYPERQVWHAIISLLIDPAVSQSKKTGALSGLAASHRDWPLEVLDVLRSSWVVIRDSRQDGLFRGLLKEGVWPEWLAAGVAIGAISAESALREVSSLQAGSPQDRVTAAAVAASAASAGPASAVWALVALLQLSADDDPDVAARAARGLPAGLSHTTFGEVVSDRLRAILLEPNALLPLAVIQGLRDVEGVRLIPDRVFVALRSCATSHPSALVRFRGQKLLDAYP